MIALAVGAANAQGPVAAKSAPIKFSDCLRKLGTDLQRTQLSLASPVFRLEHISQGVTQPDAEREATGPQYGLSATATFVESDPQTPSLITSAHSFDDALSDLKASATVTDLKAKSGDGSAVNYKVYNFQENLALKGFRLWRPLISSCSGNGVVRAGEETVDFVVSRLIRIDPDNYSIYIVGPISNDLLARLPTAVNRVETSRLVDFALLKAINWINPQSLVAVRLGARRPMSGTQTNAGSFNGFGHMLADSTPFSRALSGVALDEDKPLQLSTIGGGSFRGDSGSLAIIQDGIELHGVGLVAESLASQSNTPIGQQGCLRMVGMRELSAGPPLAISDSGDTIDAQCLQSMATTVVLAPLSYIASPEWKDFFSPLSRGQGFAAVEAEWRNGNTKVFFQSAYDEDDSAKAPDVTMPGYIQLHALYRKTKGPDNLANIALAFGTRKWANSAAKRYGYYGWQEEEFADLEKWTVQQINVGSAAVSPALAKVLVQSSEAIGKAANNVCKSAQSPNQSCKNQQLRLQHDMLELAVAAASARPDIDKREGGRWAVMLVDLRNVNNISGNVHLSGSSPYETALRLDPDAILRRGNLSDQELNNRLTNFSVHVSGNLDKIELKGDRRFYKAEDHAPSFSIDKLEREIARTAKTAAPF